ncbi:Thiosulfate sulfurtransferase, rhodanese [Halorubrum sp. DM2]|uniref:sulfurtransferase n=1 Tax=Halorubrum sp. DM2 TaxID=2527867 RepID=UPI0024B86E48|nr:rhodanese-like domain-containing protein [Halorubrum sp. DM2]VTT86370.1 Thiosulfate sulfurtransferase, rhodanese [Halorubrum sp. DM2]
MTGDHTPVDDDRAPDGDDGDRVSGEDGGNHDATRRGLLRAAAGATVAGAASTAGCLSVTTPADVAAANAVTGNVGYFVGPGWLAERRGDVVVLDARNAERYRRERVYGARRVPFDQVTARTSSENGFVPDPETIASAVGGLGVAPDDDVVIYGASVGSRVTRVAFSLEALGHEGDVRVLNGGLDGWNGRLGTGDGRDRDPVEYDPDPDPSTWVTREWIAERVGSFNGNGPGLIDVRVPEAYLGAPGSDALDPDHDRHGHLPGAVNVNWIGNVAGRRMAEPSRLVQLYEGEAGLDRGAPVVVYGGDNVDPTSTWLTLKAIGFDDVRVYDGGFDEWANVEEDRARYPVETATSVVIETDGSVGGDDDGGDFSCTG